LFKEHQALSLEDGCGRSALFKAMRDHVLARGELIGGFQR